MPFSLSSYLLGVGTVVGALAFGFGGGVLLTKTAMKDTPAETRVERVKRAEQPSALPQPVETVDTKAMPEPQPAGPAPAAAAPTPPVQASTEPAKTEPSKPVAEAPKPAEPVRAAESTAQAEPVSAAQPTPQTEPAKPAGQNEAELLKAEARKIQRQKHDAERKAKAMARAKQRQFEGQPETASPDYVYERSSRRALAFEREEPRSNSLDIPLFGRSREFLPFDRED
jgi:outer membrane biosynthesis protein TonB